jgi:hypothetical protein
MVLENMRSAAIAGVRAEQSALRPPSSPSDATPSLPVAPAILAPSSGSTDGGATGTDSVSAAYLAGLAAMGKNTAGDTSPYVVIPNQANPSGGGISIVAVLGVVALGAGAWWYFKHRGSE